MPTIEFEGKTTEEALENASNQLHLAKDELKFEIITTGSSGIFGIGGKKARIRVMVEEKISPRKLEAPAESRPREERSEPRARRDYSPRPSGRREGPRPDGFRTDARRPENRQRETSAREGQPREPQPRGDRPRDYRPRDEHRREDRPRDQHYREAARRESAIKDKARIARIEPDVDEEEGPLTTWPLPPTVVAPGESLFEGPEDEVMVFSRRTLTELLQHMGLEAEVGVSVISDRIILKVTGDNTGLLIGKKGATLDALQFLMNKIVNRERTAKLRVIVDAENYRQRRHQSLIDLANRMADKARRNRRPVTISQLSAHDRRIVHLALQEKPDLRTRSRGEGPLKNVIIIPGPGRGQEHNDEPETPDLEAGAGETLAQATTGPAGGGVSTDES
ncbi:MAG: RNA-binding cell elongation regulator Jag/EloR [Thermodesulfobacteriota bacterium]